MREIKEYTLEDLIKIASKYITEPTQIELIKKAYYYAEDKHTGQKRLSGEDYIQHALNTAIIATSIHTDTETICASLLHDVIEDCDVEKDELEKEFGLAIANLVDSVSKISSIKYKLDNENTANNYRKIIIGMSEDVRTIIIKLADRLHNMRTLWALPEEKQKRIAKVTLEILTPIAHRLGIYKIKSEMEDLCLKYLKTDIYYGIVEKLNKTKKERDTSVYEMIEYVTGILNEHNIEHEIKGRAKSIYSIYAKMEKGKRFEDIYDLLALRILVDTESNCYTALGLIHSKYKPIPSRFKDYIAQPKTNLYQSLHTTVFGANGFLFEVQIRTHEMNDVAEFGIASHIIYKEKNSKEATHKNIAERKIEFFREILDLQDTTKDSVEFLENVKNDILKANIYTYTPKGDVVELPTGATPIDFAYKVHTEVGNKMQGAIVNNKGVALSYNLKTGDIVKINTTDNGNGPNIEWIDIAVTVQAKNKIKAFHSKTNKERQAEQGQRDLEKGIRKRKLVIKETVEGQVELFIKDHKIKDIEQLYIQIAKAKYEVAEILNYNLKEEKNNQGLGIKTKKPTKTNNNDIIVQGIENIKINIGNCCEPIPGDEIIGYITKGNGISIHKTTCKNLTDTGNRMVDAKWIKNTDNKYSATITVESETSEGVLVDIVTKAKVANIQIESIQNFSKSHQATYRVTIKVANKKILESFINDITNIKEVSKVIRFSE